MALSFERFLSDKIDAELCDFFNDSEINKVEVYQNKRLWRIYVSIRYPIERRILNATANSLKKNHNFLDEIEFILDLKNSENNIKSLIENRNEDLSSQLFTGNRGLRCLKNIEWEIYDNRIDLEVNEVDDYKYIIENEICPRMAAWFWQEYSLRFVIRTICKQKSSQNEVKETWVSGRNVEKIEMFTENINKNANNKRTFNRSKKNKEQHISDTPVRIEQIEEGLKTAVVEGEIFDKETNVLRDGRLVVTYYITDYTDSIAIKSFYDKAEEDKINRGDWLKVKGSVRYDNFIKDIVLFLDKFEQQNRTLRTDNNEEKRIELHAHTKMSAMDGLTEVKDLIEQAVRWGHTAIAITDHGGVQAFPLAYSAAKNNSIKIIYGVEGYLVEDDKKEKPYHIILLAKNLTGLKNLYYLVSVSYLDYFYRQPKIPRKELMEHREGLILGTACEAGELYQAILNNADDSKLEKIVNFYDYLEIQPLANNYFLLRKQLVESEEGLRNINRKIVELGKKYNKAVVATGDVHFLEPYHEVFRTIVQVGQGYKDTEEVAPLYFKTTEEMLNEFSFLGEEDAKWVVINCPKKIADDIEEIKPVPDGFYPPKIDTAEQEVVELTWTRAHAIYGENLPRIVEERINRELNAIIKHGFSVLYLIAHKLVKKSNEDGYLVGSRGSVGSSMVAFFTGITEVNALPPHYVCPVCHYSEFFTDGSIGSGADLKDKSCPKCGENLNKNGFDIPFETFLGFEGDKVPDIDLNFSGDYQQNAHHYVEELFGSENVFKAGTISTVAEKTAYGFVKKYAEEKEINIRNAEMGRLAQGISGVRRTTGQHPGGMIVVPHDHDILEFTPIQHPADNKDSGFITTHFEYHAIGDQLVKLDILGHDDPTVIRALEDSTGVNARGISLSESKTMQLFSSVEPLGVTEDEINSKVGTFGIPEFGTAFVRQMLEATRPTTFSELVRISGLSHGTDVWLNNAQDLIENKTANLSQVICTRDDIMTYLIQKNMDKKQSFKIMENVRKGRGLKEEEISLMNKCSVPSWYINSCQKIKYMFPKAHAVAYVTMAFRIAWFKVYYPLQFYASFFSIRAEDFDADTILAGYEQVQRRIKEIEAMGYAAPQKDKKLITILELAMEMYARGFNFYPVDIYKSDSKNFIVKDNGLVLPFSALPNVGESAAQGIVHARKDGDFVSIEDFQNRSRLNKTAMEVMRRENCFHGLPESTQISLFL